MSDTQLSGPVLVQDNGSAINIVANDNSTVVGTANASNTTIALNSNSLWQIGAGPSTLSSITLDSGTIQYLGAGSIATTGDLVLDANGGTVDTNGFDATIDAVTVTGAGSLTKNGSGKLTLAAGVDYTGDTTVSGGVLQIGDGTASGTVHLAHVDNNATLAFDRPDVAQVDSIAGTGDVQQNGVGTTILNGDNTYTGGTAVNAGTLQAR